MGALAAEHIINNLTQLPALRVINRNSAFRYKGKEDDPLSAGQALGVRAVVVGRVLQRGENLIVSAELVDVRDNKQIEGWKYNRKLADVFARGLESYWLRWHPGYQAVR